jgi:hypothetical protein
MSLGRERDGLCHRSGMIDRIEWSSNLRCDKCRRWCSVRRFTNKLSEDILTRSCIVGGKTFKDQTTTSVISVTAKMV